MRSWICSPGGAGAAPASFFELRGPPGPRCWRWRLPVAPRDSRHARARRARGRPDRPSPRGAPARAGQIQSWRRQSLYEPLIVPRLLPRRRVGAASASSARRTSFAGMPAGRCAPPNRAGLCRRAARQPQAAGSPAICFIPHADRGAAGCPLRAGRSRSPDFICRRRALPVSEPDPAASAGEDELLPRPAPPPRCSRPPWTWAAGTPPSDSRCPGGDGRHGCSRCPARMPVRPRPLPGIRRLPPPAAPADPRSARIVDRQIELNPGVLPLALRERLGRSNAGCSKSRSTNSSNASVSPPRRRCARGLRVVAGVSPSAIFRPRSRAKPGGESPIRRTPRASRPPASPAGCSTRRCARRGAG